MLTVNAQTKEIWITRGTDERVKFTIRDSTGALLDVSAGTFKLTVRQAYDGTIIMQLASPAANGIDLTDAATGVVVATLPRTITANMGGRYVYDLQMTLAGAVHIPALGSLVVPKDVTGTGAAPVVVPPLQFLTYLVLHFERQLQDGDILVSDLDLARTSTITIRHAHVDADVGPDGGDATIALQDDLSAPTQIVNLIVPDSSGVAVHQTFDVDATVPTLTAFALTHAGGKTLTVKCTTASLIERGNVILGYTYA